MRHGAEPADHGGFAAQIVAAGGGAVGHSEFEVRIDRSPAVVRGCVTDWRDELDWQDAGLAA